MPPTSLSEFLEHIEENRRDSSNLIYVIIDKARPANDRLVGYTGYSGASATDMKVNYGAIMLLPAAQVPLHILCKPASLTETVLAHLRSNARHRSAPAVCSRSKSQRPRVEVSRHSWDRVFVLMLSGRMVTWIAYEVTYGQLDTCINAESNHLSITRHPYAVHSGWASRRSA